MPEMDGLAVAAMVKAEPDLRDVSIVLLTSAGCWRELQHNKPGLFDACLTKPVRQSHLLNTLTMTWAKRRQIRAIQAPPEPPHRDAGALAARFAGLPMRVMVVEDNLINQRVAVRILDRLGLRPEIAGNGLEAVRLFQAQPHDLIFMDCQMPELDGYEATRQIRHLQAPDRHPVIIAMTAEALAGARETCLEAGMDHYISKPIKLEDVCDALDAWAPVRAAGA